MGVVVRRYIDFLILLIPTPLVSVLFCSSIPRLWVWLSLILFLKHLKNEEKVALCFNDSLGCALV